ncbi:hypothetical protein F5148DRAFT_1177702 [Russula earlei]|uniref:Uncharacterized protein n=1 Tax=Russula earlei TaxID=71964 RepID=A0ACC0UG30_9AGAM|nr:hypothetical protein F5148DRAFT_1177702 [Russula earlei]
MVAHHNSLSNPNPPWNQCIFIRGFRARRVLWTIRVIGLEGAPSPRFDNPREDEIQVERIPDAPKTRHPLIEVGDDIAEVRLPDHSLQPPQKKLPEDAISIIHPDDFWPIEDETENEGEAISSEDIPETIENGAALMPDDEPAVPDDAIAIFFARAELEGEPVPLVVNPALTEYLLKLEFGNPADHDYGLPNETITSTAVHPPMLSLILENHQGYPQLIIQASGGYPGAVVTVQDILRTIHEDVRKPLLRRELIKLKVDEQAVIDASFIERCKTEEDLNIGPRRFDLLGGRNRLHILPKHPHDNATLYSSSHSEEALDESSVAGPSRIR